MTAMQLVWTIIKILIMVGFVLNLAAILTWADRRQSSMIQDRIGPNRAVIKVFGKEFRLAGLLHPAADGLKFFTKEDFMPLRADRLLFMLAPIMAMGMVFTLVGHHPLRGHRVSAAVPPAFRVALAAHRGTVCAALGHLLARREKLPLPDRAHRRAARRRHPLRVRDVGAGNHRRRDRGLVERQQVQLDGGAARREPDGLVRGHARHVAHRRHDDLRDGSSRRNGAMAGATTPGASSFSRSRSSFSSRLPSPRTSVSRSTCPRPRASSCPDTSPSTPG